MTEEEKKYYKTAVKLLKISNAMFAKMSTEPTPKEIAERAVIVNSQMSECVKLLEPLKAEVDAPMFRQLTIFDVIDS